MGLFHDHHSLVGLKFGEVFWFGDGAEEFMGLLTDFLGETSQQRYDQYYQQQEQPYRTKRCSNSNRSSRNTKLKKTNARLTLPAKLPMLSVLPKTDQSFKRPMNSSAPSPNQNTSPNLRPTRE